MVEAPAGGSERNPGETPGHVLPDGLLCVAGPSSAGSQKVLLQKVEARGASGKGVGSRLVSDRGLRRLRGHLLTLALCSFDLLDVLPAGLEAAQLMFRPAGTVTNWFFQPSG